MFFLLSSTETIADDKHTWCWSFGRHCTCGHYSWGCSCFIWITGTWWAPLRTEGWKKKKLELQLVLWASSCHILLVVANDLGWGWLSLASHTDVLRGSSPVPAPRTSAEPKDKFLSHFLQKYQLVITWRLSEIQSALLKSKCWQAKHIRTSSVECDTWPKIFAAGENLGDKRWVFVYFSL